MKLWELFWTFVKIGAQAFGGGYTIIVIVKSALVEKKKWLTEKQVIDYLAMSSSLPGIIAINFSAFTGFHRAGVLGAISAVLGVITAPLVIILSIAGLITQISNHPWLKYALEGIQLAVCALLLSFTITLIKKSVNTVGTKLIAAGTFCTFCLFHLSPFWPMIIAGLIGWLSYKYKKKVLGS